MSSGPYENGVFSQVTGGPLRPGGLDLTTRMLELCELPAGARVLDVGCGTGSTLDELQASTNYKVYGIDRSEVLLQTAMILHPDLPLACGWGQSLPFADGQMDAVMAECSLSAMSNLDGVLSEFRRVLHPGGKLAVTDLYARNPLGLSALRALPARCGLRDVLTRAELEQHLQAHDFEIQVWEDHSETIKVLAAQMIMAHGSMHEFWSKSEPEADPFELQLALSKAKLGYYLLVAGTHYR